MVVDVVVVVLAGVVGADVVARRVVGAASSAEDAEQAPAREATRSATTAERHGMEPRQCTDANSKVMSDPHPPGGHPTSRTGYRPLTTSAMSSPASVGFSPTFTPAARRASILPCAVPLPPETIAPAWPIFLPGGAVTPAM